MTNKIAVTSVTIVRAEGPSHLCDKPETFTSLAKATTRLREWSWSAPKAGDGYDKCDFAIVFANGETYEGRFDLQQNLAGEGSLEQHIQQHVKFYAGLFCPAHMKRARYESYINEIGQQAASLAFLAKYDLGGEVALPEPKPELDYANAGLNLYRSLTADEKAGIAFGLYPSEKVQPFLAKGYNLHELVVALNETAAKAAEIWAQVKGGGK